MRSQVRTENQAEPVPDEQIIEEVSDIGTQLILSHRDQVAYLNDIEEHLLNELACGSGKVHVSNYKGEIILTKLNLTIKEKTSSYKDLVGAMAQRITLERQSFGITDDYDGDEDQEHIIEVTLED